jgi:RNA polymerase sigma factor (sigma-70 family)
MEDARSDAEILERSSRDPELFGVVFDRHFAAIHRYLDRRVGADEADELAGEVFRIAFERRSRYRDLHESALPWLYGIATNLVLKRWRGEERRLRALARAQAGEVPGGGDMEDADMRIASAAARARLLKALAGLSKGDRDVVLLVAWQELSYEEVAAALEIPPGTVRSRLNRARGILREHLGDFGDEPVTVPLRATGRDGHDR